MPWRSRCSHRCARITCRNSVYNPEVEPFYDDLKTHRCREKQLRPGGYGWVPEKATDFSGFDWHTCAIAARIAPTRDVNSGVKLVNL